MANASIKYILHDYQNFFFLNTSCTIYCHILFKFPNNFKHDDQYQKN